VNFGPKVVPIGMNCTTFKLKLALIALIGATFWPKIVLITEKIKIKNNFTQGQT